MRGRCACLPTETWQEFLATAGNPGGGFGFLDDQLKTLVVVDDNIMYPDDHWYPVDRKALRRQLLSGSSVYLRPNESTPEP